MRKLFLLTTLLTTLFSCEKVFLGEDEVNSPENNFEIFWDDFDAHYGLFEARGWNWDSLYTLYRPQVTAQTTDDELWTIFRDMIAYLDDSHTFIYNPTKAFFASGSELDEQVATEFSIELLKRKYLENIVDIPVSDPDDNYLYGKIKDKDIGYIYLNGVETDNPNLMDDILQEIGQHQAIVMDIRNNFGGDDETARDFAGRFADGEHLVYTVQERNGPAHNDFSEKINYFTDRRGEEHFQKPVILLTDRITVSAGEVLTLHMKAFGNVTQMGDTTAGDFSDTGMRRFLPNGWQYQYSIMMFLLPNGETLDGLGHVPAIQVRNSASDIMADNDLVIEEAIQYLFDEYGIQ